MKNREIAKVIFGQRQAMGDMFVRQPLPSTSLDYLDPFVLLHHGENEVDEDLELRHAGVAPHPHRGFAPVTFVFEGGVHHQDSRGNVGTVYKGGVQWMNAGMGIIHSERPAVGGMQEIVQMWINSPARHKMDAPTYYPLTNENAPKFTSDNGLVTASVVSGSLLGLTGPIPTLSPINSAMITAEPGGQLRLTFPENHNAFLYVLKGAVTIGGRTVAAHNMIVFENNGEGVDIAFETETKALFMSGEPIGEKIVAQGPFVLNNEVQIMEAYRDYRMGKMGVLIEE